MPETKQEQKGAPSAHAAKKPPCVRCGHKNSEHRNIQPPPWNWRGCSVLGCRCASYKPAKPERGNQ